MINVTASRDASFGPEHAEAQFEAILERVLRAYHRNEGHGGANWIGESLLDAELVPVAREAFLDADDMPPDHEVLQVLDGEGDASSRRGLPRHDAGRSPPTGSS